MDATYLAVSLVYVPCVVWVGRGTGGGKKSCVYVSYHKPFTHRAAPIATHLTSPRLASPRTISPHHIEIQFLDPAVPGGTRQSRQEGKKIDIKHMIVEQGLDSPFPSSLSCLSVCLSVWCPCIMYAPIRLYDPSVAW